MNKGLKEVKRIVKTFPAWERASAGTPDRMDATVAVVLALVLVLPPLIFVGGVFVWAAVKDGQEDRALQRRLGIRRRTRLGR